MGNEHPTLPPGYRMTELGPLPEEWRVVRLGEVAHITSGGSAPQGDIYFGGKHPFVRVQHLGEGDFFVQRWDLITDEAVKIYSLRLFPKGTIIFPKSGAFIRLEKRAILPIPAYLVSHLCAVIPDIRLVERNFLFYALKNRRLAAEKAEGYPTLTLAEIKEVPIPLPPLPEQRAIAHVLRTVQEAKEATERVVAALRELKKSLMRHLFTYGPRGFTTENTENTEKISVNSVRSVVNLKDTEIGPIPEHWEMVRLGEVVERPQYGYTASASNAPVGPKFLRITDIQDGKVFWPSVPFCQVAQSQIEHYLLKSGDILVARIGATTGKTFLVAECPPAIFASYLIRLRVAPEKGLLSDYLSYFTDTEAYWAQINSNKGGRLKQGINIPILENLVIPLPPLPEQQEIARILRAVDGRIQAEEAYARALDDLFKSLLRELMSGRLRVVPDFVAQSAVGARHRLAPMLPTSSALFTSPMIEETKDTG